MLSVLARTSSGAEKTNHCDWSIRWVAFLLIHACLNEIRTHFSYGDLFAFLCIKAIPFVKNLTAFEFKCMRSNSNACVRIQMHAFEFSGMQLNSRACNRMQCFHQNAFSSLSFRVEDVRPARMHSIACSRIRLHAREFDCMLANSIAGSRIQLNS